MFNKLKTKFKGLFDRSEQPKYKEIRGDVYELNDVVTSMVSVKPIRKEFVKKGYRVHIKRVDMGQFEIWVSKKGA